MAKFDAATAVEELEYDFTKYGGRAGVIPEPTTGAVNEYFASIRELVKEVQNMRASATDLEGVDIEEMDEAATTEAFDRIDAVSAEAADFQQRTIEAVAVLCGGERLPNPDYEEGGNRPETVVAGGSPDVDDLNRLPVRVLQAFSRWLMEQINPKSGEQEPERKQPQDRRRRASTGSRGGRG